MRVICAAITITLLSTAAIAQQPDAFDVCAREKDPTARLACFDQEIQRRHAATAKARTEDNVGLQGDALQPKRKDEGVTPQPVKPIVAMITRLLPRSYGQYAFVLDNGQTWEQVEVEANLNVKLHDTVTIKPGVLGSFFLSTTRSQRVRVRRIR